MTQPIMHPVHAASERFPLVLMWILVGLFLIAVPFMFVHPGVTLLLFWIGFVLLGVGTLIHRVVFGGARTEIEDIAVRCACPGCGADLGFAQPDGTEQRCEACDTAFRMIDGRPAPTSLDV